MPTVLSEIARVEQALEDDFMSSDDANSKREPRNFLEQHALKALQADPTWTVTMYAVFNDLSDESTNELREFLKPHLPEAQWSVNH